MRVDFKRTDRKDIENLVATVNAIPRYSAATKSDLNKVVKVLQVREARKHR